MEKIFLIFCFFPFVSPFPMQSDVQPIAGILAVAVIIKNQFFFNKPIQIKTFNLIFISFMFLLYNDLFSPNFNADFGKMISLIFGSFMILAFQQSRHYLSKNILNFSISIYFIYSLLILFDTSLFYYLQNFIVRQTNTVELSYRGISTFSTEPGLFGGLLIFFLLVIDYCFLNKIITKINMYALKVLVVTMIFLTKSGSGYVYFMLYLFLFLLDKDNNFSKTYILSFFTMIFFILARIVITEDFSSYGRGFQIITKLNNPLDLINTDTSIFSRLVNSSMSFFAIANNPFGVGNGSVISEAQIIAHNNNFLNSWFKGRYVDFNSSFSYLSFSHGLIFWIFFFYLYTSFSKSKLINKIFSMIFFIFSYSAAFPAIWVLLSLKKTK